MTRAKLRTKLFWLARETLREAERAQDLGFTEIHIELMLMIDEFAHMANHGAGYIRPSNRKT